MFIYYLVAPSRIDDTTQQAPKFCSYNTDNAGKSKIIIKLRLYFTLIIKYVLFLFPRSPIQN